LSGRYRLYSDAKILLFSGKSVKQVVPPQGGERMTTMEVLTLLLLLAAVIFGILGYIKK